MNYKQSIYNIKWSYIKNNFEYSIDSFSGLRIEKSDKVKIKTCKNSLENIDLDITKKDLNQLEKIIKLNDRFLIKKGISISTHLNLHNEKVQIDNHVNDNRSYGFFRLIFKDNNRNMHIEDVFFSHVNLEKLENQIYSRINDHMNLIGNLSKKRFLKYDSISVILSPQVTGYFIHEILGHTLEEDFFSYYKKRYIKLKIPKKLTVIDNANLLIPFQKYDDKGIKIRPITLIKDGKICNILSTKIEQSFDKTLYGVARRQSYKFDTLPRMRCTYLKPYDDLSEQDILHKYEDAIFVNEAFSGGVNQNTGDYSLNGNGFIIKSGEIQNFVGKLRLSGNILSSLAQFEYIGQDFKIFNSYCKKFGQSVRVGIGGPTTSISNLKVSGELYE